jgi:2-oxoglutarate/2-oxoacid ferredoxin oxidoreductase subunit beta
MSNLNETESQEEAPEYSKKDFMSDQLLRWCPGCGDYSILSQTQTVMAGLGIPKEKFAIISGIGCSSRFPYYMNTYGFHSIHGRAPTFATAAKCVNEELSTWVITGDGDALSIGGNHFAHVLRRNVDLQILLFNNRIYGLTKGQYSPTSEIGKKTKSSPMGSLDRPFMPLKFALGAGATFLARSVDIYAKPLRATLVEAESHKGTSLVEIYQNCNIFNDLAFDDVVNRKVKDERVLFLEHGQPMVFGAKDAPKGLRLNGMKMEVIELGGEFSEADCLVHDRGNTLLASILVQLDYPEFPVPMGVIFQTEAPTYNEVFNLQVKEAVEKNGKGALKDLIYSGQTWTVE